NTGSFNVSNGVVTKNCDGHKTTGYTTTCSDPVAVGKGFMQEIISIKNNTSGVVKQYIHTVVVDQNANSGNIPGAPNAGGAKQFADESLVSYNTDQTQQTNGNESGIWAQQKIFEPATGGNLQTAFNSTTELAMGWGNTDPSGTKGAVTISQGVNQQNTQCAAPPCTTGQAGLIGNRFDTSFKYVADVDKDGNRLGYTTSIGQLTGLHNNGTNSKEGDVQSFKLVQVSGSYNAPASVGVSLPSMSTGPNTLTLLGGAGTVDNPMGSQAIWLGQNIASNNTTAGGGATTTAGAMKFGYQSFDSLSDAKNPIFYYSLLDNGPFQNSAGQDAWGSAGIFGVAPTLADPFGPNF
ncbi:MAG: hypothetical protein OEW08_12855, partial [Gammaproteobacteria bacterium]|nr:hypothetical protein [Gammaproteobacteria bacterium]